MELKDLSCLQLIEWVKKKKTKKEDVGVTLYVDTAFRCGIVENISSTMDGIRLILTIEMYHDNSEKIIIKCI